MATAINVEPTGGGKAAMTTPGKPIGPAAHGSYAGPPAGFVLP